MKTRIMRIALGALGLFVMGYAVYGAVTDPGTNLPGQAVFLAAVLVGHDFVLLPIGLAVGALVARAVPVPYRILVQSVLWAGAVVALIALPLIVAG